jgi:hypothetical protein
MRSFNAISRGLAIPAAVFVLAVFSGMSSCVERQAVLPPEMPQYRGQVDVDVLRDALAFKGVRSIKSEVDVAVYRKGDRLGRFKGIFAFRSPGSLRLRLLSPMGLTAMEVVMSGEFLQVHLSGKNALYEGKAPPFSMPANAFYGMEKEEGSYILYAFRPTGGVMTLTGKYSFDSGTLRNTGVTLYNDGRRYMGMLLGDVSSRGAPEFLRLSFFNGFVMEMTLKKPEVDAEVPDKYFTPIKRGGKSVYPIDLLLEER